jgi:hypothetical protein
MVTKDTMGTTRIHPIITIVREESLVMEVVWLAATALHLSISC